MKNKLQREMVGTAPTEWKRVMWNGNDVIVDYWSLSVTLLNNISLDKFKQ